MFANRLNWLPVISLLIATVLWASSFIALKLAFRSYDPMFVIFGRMAVASACFVFFLPGFLKKIDYRSGDIRRIAFMAAGESLEILDAPNANARTFDTLADVFRLYRTMNTSGEFVKFEFLTRWSSLSDEDKRSKSVTNRSTCAGFPARSSSRSSTTRARCGWV